MIEQELDLYWKTVVDTIQDGVMILDDRGTIVTINKAFETITGYSRDEVIGKNCHILNCSSCALARGKQGEHWCVLFRTGNLRMKRCALLKKDGDYVHILKNASVLRDMTGKVIGAVETLTDLTEIIKKDNRIEAFQRQLRSEDSFHGIVGSANSMRQVFDMITNAARSDAPVMILGESGTGKELIAQAIHELGPRKHKPFIKVNCASLNEALLESELFGHVKGAFTGAYRAREGRFEAAKGGDLLLDEVGDLPLSTQVKLLRVLEEKVIERVGDNKPIQIDVRIISATNKNLRELVDDGVFREDLYYRVNTIPITAPALRDRMEDFPLLAEFFFQKIKLKSGKNIGAISNEAMALMLRYPWPGNVRELKGALEYAFVSCQESEIQPYHLPPAIAHGKENGESAPRKPAGRKETQKERLINALRQADGNQSEAARILGVSRVTVWNRMKKFGVDPDRGDYS